MILLDTDVCIEILRGNKKIISKRESYDGPIAISFISVAELHYGAYKSAYVEKNISLVEEFLLSIQIIESNFLVSRKFGELKANLSQSGQMISDADLFIASTALVHCEKLVTGNVNHFKRIDNLPLENWTR